MKGLFTLLMLAVFQCGTAGADPALWKAERGEATVYIFGTLHAAGGDEAWRTDAVLAAYNASGTVMLETETNGDAGDLRALGVSEQPTAIPASLQPLYNERVAASGLPQSGLAQLRPWLQALVLARGEGLGTGPDRFVDRIIEEDAAMRGKWLIYLEPPRAQAERLARLPDSAALSLLEETLRPPARDSVLSAWSTGDSEALDMALNANRRQTAPAVHNALISTPNAEWAAVINEVSRTDAALFVAVGAAHTVGPDSVQSALMQHGFTVTAITEPLETP